MQPILMVDNYDSFTYNIVQYVEALGAEVVVAMNDDDLLPIYERLKPKLVVISPGPGRPGEAGTLMPFLAALPPDQPVFGVCLGMQAMTALSGARIRHAPSLMHGKTSDIHHDMSGIFSGLPCPLRVARYHSLVVDPDTLSTPWRVTAWTRDGVLMACRHNDAPWQAVQFHPESIATEHGMQLLNNVLVMNKIKKSPHKRPDVD